MGAGGRRALVGAGPGIVVSAVSQIEDPDGDPAAFAVSWSRLLDASLLPAPGIVSLGERADAGARGMRRPGEVEPDAPPEAAGISAWLAGGAAIFLALSLGVRLR